MPQVRSPEVHYFFCGRENGCVHSLCMGTDMHTALLVFSQLDSINEGFKLCWRTGQKLTLKPSFFSYSDYELECVCISTVNLFTFLLYSLFQ